MLQCPCAVVGKEFTLACLGLYCCTNLQWQAGWGLLQMLPGLASLAPTLQTGRQAAGHAGDTLVRAGQSATQDPPYFLSTASHPRRLLHQLPQCPITPRGPFKPVRCCGGRWRADRMEDLTPPDHITTDQTQLPTPFVLPVTIPTPDTLFTSCGVRWRTACRTSRRRRSASHMTLQTLNPTPI